MSEQKDVLAQCSQAQPVAWRVKDFADGWILCHTLAVAEHEADGQCLIQPLSAGPIPFGSSTPAGCSPVMDGNSICKFIYERMEDETLASLGPACRALADHLRVLAAQAPAEGETQAGVSKWADETFGPASSNARVAARANEEMAELLRALTADDNHEKAAEEVADVVIVLYRLMTRLGADMATEINRKMAINRARKWNLTADGHGYHVRDRHPLTSTVSQPAPCDHQWRDVDSQSDNAVKCDLCGVPGERQRNGSVYWPAT